MVMNIIGPAIGAFVFILIMSLLKEPARREFNAIFVAGAAGVYISGGGFGVLELPYAAIAAGVSYLGLRSYRWIGAAWLMHTGWDLMHHRFGNPLWPFMPESSMGCAIMDALIAVWFLLGAPSARPWKARA